MFDGAQQIEVKPKWSQKELCVCKVVEELGKLQLRIPG